MASKRSSSRKSGKKRSGSKGRPPPRRRDGKAALRGMLVGVLVFAVLAVVFLVPINGATPFSHLLAALNLTGDEVTDPNVGPEVAPNAATAPPLEDVTDEEQEGLDDLIEQKTEK